MSGTTSTQARPTWLAEYDAFLTDLLRGSGAPGAAVCVTSGDRVVYARGFGWRDREARLPATPRTVFGLASLSKSFTALLALVLEAQGTWSLESPLSEVLPGFGYPGLDTADVRLWHMLSHTTGVPPLRALDYALAADQRGDVPDVYGGRDVSLDPDVSDYGRLMEYMRAGERSLLGSPGDIVSYSNECVALVGAAAERATGRPFPEVLRELVLGPLGMTATSFDPHGHGVTDVATLYTRTREGVVRSPTWSRAPAYLGTGFLRSSVLDLSRYLRFLTRGDGSELGLPEGRITELTRGRQWSQPGGSYAMGWSVREQGGVKVVRHGGSLKGVSTSQGFVPELGLGVTVLINLDEAPALRAWQAAVNLALGDPAERPLYGDGHQPLLGRTGDDATRSTLERLAGTYSSGEPWGRLELRLVEAEAGAAGLEAYVGEDATFSGRLALMAPEVPAGPGTAEFVLVGEHGAWDGGRVHVGPSGEVTAVQHGTRWYDREPPV